MAYQAALADQADPAGLAEHLEEPTEPSVPCGAARRLLLLVHAAAQRVAEVSAVADRGHPVSVGRPVQDEQVGRVAAPPAQAVRAGQADRVARVGAADPPVAAASALVAAGVAVASAAEDLRAPSELSARPAAARHLPARVRAAEIGQAVRADQVVHQPVQASVVAVVVAAA